jgi:hypothetical protein
MPIKERPFVSVPVISYSFIPYSKKSKKKLDSQRYVCYKGNNCSVMAIKTRCLASKLGCGRG